MSFAAFSFSGTVQESGPDYAYNGGYCGRAAHGIEWQDDGLWFVGSLPDWGNWTDPMMVVSTTGVIMMHSGCSEITPRLAWANGSYPLGLGVWSPPQVWHLAVHSGNATLDGMPLDDGNATISFHESDERSPTQYDQHDGTYSYDGDLLLHRLGDMDSTHVHAVAGCDELPSGC